MRRYSCLLIVVAWILLRLMSRLDNMYALSTGHGRARLRHMVRGKSTCGEQGATISVNLDPPFSYLMQLSVARRDGLAARVCLQIRLGGKSSLCGSD
jgi:hypothetical protein